MQKGVPATAGSKMLADFISPIDATVVTRLEAAGVQIVGRCDVGEFGVDGLFGSSVDGKTGGQVHCLGRTQDSVPVPLSCLLADSEADFILCNDYIGAISLAAAKQGLYYIHPTYGSVSRYGLIPAVSSMDQIGVLCKKPVVGFEVLKMITGFDSKDGVMIQRINDKGQMTNDKGQMTNNKEYTADAGTDEPSPCLKPRKRDSEKYSEILPQIMQILCCAEIGNNISRYDGIKFGYRAKGYNGLHELYTKSRTEAFGEDIKLAAVIGAMVLSQENYMRYYDKAMRLRRLIRDSLEFDKYDVIINDKGQMTNDKGQEKSQTEKWNSFYNLLTLSRLCGLPSLATPEGVYVANTGRDDILEAQLLCNMK